MGRAGSERMKTAKDGDLRARRLALRDYSEDELIEELARRKNERIISKPSQWCDQCIHFKTLPEKAPDSANPCAKGHKMQFIGPEDYCDEEFGFYRRVCADRQEAEQD